MRLNHYLPALILTLSVFSPAAELKPEMRLYDLSDLTGEARSFEPPRTLLVNSQVQSVAQEPFAAPAPPTIQMFADMIRTRVRPETWDPAHGTSIEEIGGLLVIRQSAAVHALIADLCAKFREDHADLPRGAGTTSTTKKFFPPPEKKRGAKAPAEKELQEEQTTTTSQGDAHLIGGQYIAGYEFDTASISVNSVQSQVLVPKGKWVLTGAFNNPDAKAPKNLLLFLSADVVDEAAKK